MNSVIDVLAVGNDEFNKNQWFWSFSSNAAQIDPCSVGVESIGSAAPKSSVTAPIAMRFTKSPSFNMKWLDSHKS
jgi:hypothetical protein